MNITFTGKYKSITDFTWTDIPNFTVITGPNGSGKSQLLELIYNTVLDLKNSNVIKAKIEENRITMPNEVTFLKGEWQLQDTHSVALFSIQQKLDQHYENLIAGSYAENNYNRVNNLPLAYALDEVLKKSGKHFSKVTRQEFDENFPEVLIEDQISLGQKISEVFYNYRLSEIELKSEGVNEEEVVSRIGEKPWIVLREIIKESKLPFDINDPSQLGFRDAFHLKLVHQVLKEEVRLNDLSSGEKVLISLVFNLYNSQEKKVFPKLLLLDEPDAHLHPSMSQQFLNVIKNVLVDKFGVQVIMTTHSPSTVMLAPEGSIYEMSRIEPRIQKTTSKNQAVSLLTSGLVYVGEGTRYYLVEDEDDVKFYTYIYNKLVSDGQLTADIPLVFIAASTKDKSGGKDVVHNWVNKLKDSGLKNILHGLIDQDSGNTTYDSVSKLDRYSIENYLSDPIVVYATLIDKEKNEDIENIKFTVGEEYKLKSLPQDQLQKIANHIISKVQPLLISIFPDLSSEDNILVDVKFLNGIILQYPKWLLDRRGKTIINELYNKVFTSPVINFSSLFKTLKKLNIFPNELVIKFDELINDNQF